ncbi:hypothetical protein JYU34_014070 [Plutella xylostella]|uniref:Reverse transcriptase domain-containing protein n=1 Tax=Plutella xylostella TaxID=51655 RepID=A0ABQ7Q7I6_PLUXY|nr:hypothetical protein JYU34_014070 [Plutella xylostella]
MVFNCNDVTQNYCVNFENTSTWLTYLRNERSKDINICHLNVRSLKKHYNEILTQLSDGSKYLDIIIFSEINLKDDYVSMYPIPGYEAYAVCRQTKKGGGLLVYVRKEHAFQREAAAAAATSFESLAGSIEVRGMRLYLIAVYRPPTSKIVQSKVPVFLREIESVINSVPRDRELIIIGDININTLNSLHPDTILYEDMLCEYGLLNIISGITREEIRDGTLLVSCLDHILLRLCKIHDFGSSIVRCGISDHHLICLNINIHEKNITHETKTKQVLNNQAIKTKLSNINWSEVLYLDCPLLMYEKLCKTFSDIYRNNVKTVKLRNTTVDSCPWLTKEIKDCILHKDRLYKKWRDKPSDMVRRLEYTKFRNKTSKLINKSQNNYKKSLLLKYRGNSKKIWKCINEWLGRNKRSLDEVILQYMGTQYDLPTICSNFAHTFANEVLELKSKHNCNTSLLNREDYTSELDRSIRFIKITSLQVEKIIDQLDSQISPGFDKIRSSDLKHIKKEISPVIAKMINLFIQHSKYPDELKISIIRPIFKGGNHKLPTNYRPIAILSCINKIVEKAITGQILNFLTKHDVITSAQYGFQTGKSTSTLLSKFSNEINNHLNNKRHVGVIFIDFRKAFDTLNHEVLLRSMESCGIRGKLNDWFKQYLSGRKLSVKVSDYTGGCEDVKYGVATGSVTGPACYIMHVNSMPNVVKYCNTYMFADDTCLVYGHKDPLEIQKYLQIDFDNITRWAHDNGIILNVNKTSVIHICSNYLRKKDRDKQLIVLGHSYDCLHCNNNINCTCQAIQQVTDCKYLGIIIENNFHWKKHINCLIDKLRILLVKFHQLKYSVPRSVLYCLYFALVESLITYGITTYGSSFKTYINKIKDIQRRFLKILLGNNKEDKNTCLFKQCKILPVDKKYSFEVAKAEYWQDTFKSKPKSKINTRKVTEGRLFVPKVNNVYGNRTKEYVVPKIFNVMSTLTKDVMPNKIRARNTALKNHFLQI